MNTRREPNTSSAMFAMPGLLGLLTAFGLAAALLGEAPFWRWCAWLALSAPFVVIGRKLLRARLGS